jgi:hypothetical protein
MRLTLELNGMKVFGDLVVRGSRQALEEFIAALEHALTSGWTRNYNREAEVSKAALGRMYCFACTPDGARPASELWIATHSDGSLYVSNILAREFSSLTYDQYNLILTDFCENCARPASRAVEVAIELGNPDPTLEDFLSTSAARLLRSFSAMANRSILHPVDRKRWNDFLAAAYREGASLHPSMLQRWLIEEEKWPEDEAITLAVEYEHARELLGVYESQHA